MQIDRHTITDERPCARCRRSLPRSEFHAQPRAADGLSSWCKDCARERTKQWRADHREALNEARRAQYRKAREGKPFYGLAR